MSWAGGDRRDEKLASSCGHENPPFARFCLECGTSLALRCTRCQVELPATAKFCLEWRRVDHPLSLALTLFQNGVVHFERGEFDRMATI